MSLLEAAFEPCILYDKITQPDGRGGVTTTWKDGAEFQAAIAFNSSMQAKIAQAAGVTALYTITTRKSVNLQFRDVFRRLSDGKIFRVTSDGDDNHTPASAGLNMRCVSAEEWTLPRD